MSKNLSAKYYEENNEKLQKKLVKDIKIFLMKKKQKGDNMAVNVRKLFRKMKNKSLLRIKKDYYKMRKNALL